MHQLQYGKRGSLKPGDLFKVGAGPTYNGRDIGVRGTFRVKAFWAKGKRVYCEAVRLHKGYSLGQYTLYVQGKPYRRQQTPGLVMRPYKVRKKRQP